MQKVEWEFIPAEGSAQMARTKVPGGWLVMVTQDVQSEMPEHIPYGQRAGFEYRSSICFYPDPFHKWGEELKDPDNE